MIILRTCRGRFPFRNCGAPLRNEVSRPWAIAVTIDEEAEEGEEEEGEEAEEDEDGDVVVDDFD